MGVTSNLHVLDPSMVTIRFAGGRAEYVVSGVPEPLGPGEIMHIKGMTLPGQLRGVSPLEAARDVVDGGRKAQDFGTSFMANNAMPPGVIEMPDDPIGNGRERARAVAEAWNESHGGTANAGKVGVLLGGASLKTIAIKPTDAEWLDSKRFGVSEIARFYGVPPHLIADASNSTSWGRASPSRTWPLGSSRCGRGSNASRAHNRLLVSDGLAKAFIKLNLDALLRASLADRYAPLRDRHRQPLLAPERGPPVRGPRAAS